ncbi:MAG: hypothetical protein JSV84_11560 [Gemmatimonadota bacterium]|nr:MAG: hypothetical protein JSV84_11560 [Gemmatimonadota bacterium]
MWDRKKRCALLLFFFFLSVYLLAMGGRNVSVDSGPKYELTKSLVERRSIAIPWRVMATESRHDDKIFSPYGLGFSAVAGIFYSWGKVMERVIPPELHQYFANGDLPYFFTTTTNQFIMALFCMVFFLFCCKFGYPISVSMILTLIVGLGTNVLPMSKFFYGTGLLMLLIWLSLYLLLGYKLERKPYHLFLAGFFLGASSLARFQGFFVAFPAVTLYMLAAVIFDQGRRRGLPEIVRDVLLFGVGFMLPMTILFYYNYVRFLDIFDVSGTGLRHFSGKVYVGLYGYLFSPGKSIFIWSPPVILFFFSIKKFYHDHKFESLLFLWIILFQIVFYSKSDFWHGDAGFGPRYIVPIIPFMILPVGQLLTSAHMKTSLPLKLLFFGVCFAGIFVQMVGASVNFDHFCFVRWHIIESVRFVPHWSPLIVYWNEYIKNGDVLYWFYDLLRSDAPLSLKSIILIPILSLLTTLIAMRSALKESFTLFHFSRDKIFLREKTKEMSRLFTRYRRETLISFVILIALLFGWQIYQSTHTYTFHRKPFLDEPRVFDRRSQNIQQLQGKIHGLVGDYYENYYGEKKFRQQDPHIAIDIATIHKKPRPIPGELSVQWNGNLFVEQSGIYKIMLDSDDGSQLFLDGVYLIDNGGTHQRQKRIVTLHLSEGFHPVTVEYFENGLGDGQMYLWWVKPGRRLKEIIPEDAFYIPEINSEEKKHYELGLIYHRHALFQSARMKYEGVLQKNPSHVGAMINVKRAEKHQPPVESGLNGTYFWDPEKDQEPFLTRRDAPISFGSESLKHPFHSGQDFSVHWTGELWVPRSGEYNFKLKAQGKASVSLNGEPLLKTPECDDATGAVHTAAVFLDHSLHHIEIKYRSSTEGAQIELLWRPPDEEMTPLPEIYLWTHSLNEKDALSFFNWSSAEYYHAQGNMPRAVEAWLTTAALTPGSKNAILRAVEETYVNGLTGEIYSGTAFQGQPVMTTRYPEISINWTDKQTRPLPDSLSAKWTGTIFIETEGEYQFALTSDDGSHFYVDDEEVVNNGGFHPIQKRFGLRRLSKGFHKIEVRYMDNGIGNAELCLTWIPPGETRETLIPGEVLFISEIRSLNDRDFQLATLYQRHRFYDEARQKCRALLRRDPFHSGARKLLDAVLLQLRDSASQFVPQGDSASHGRGISNRGEEL